MSRQTDWAKVEKARMKFILGGKCQICGVKNNLTFDCIKPMGHSHHKAGSVARITFYRSQMRLGNLQLLCHDCNSRKRDLPMARYVTSVRPTDFSDEFLDFV